jgi:hypothetical protein
MSPTCFVDNFVENSLSVRCNPHEITLTSRVTKIEQLKDERIQGLTVNPLGIWGLSQLLTLSLASAPSGPHRRQTQHSCGKKSNVLCCADWWSSRVNSINP